MEDRHENLALMRERGFACLEAAKAKGDEHGLMLWQRSISVIESLIIKSRGESAET